MKKCKKFTEEEKKEIIRLYEEELLRASKIGEKFNCSITPIFRILKENNIDTTPSTRKIKIFLKNEGKSYKNAGFDEDKLQLLKKLYTIENMSSGKISKIFNCSRNFVLGKLRGMNVKINKNNSIFLKGKTIEEIYGKDKSEEIRIKQIGMKPHLKKIDKNIEESIIKLYSEGFGATDIARRFNLSKSIINRILRTSNIKIRGMSESKKKYFENNRSPLKMELDKNKIISLYKKGYGCYIIGKKLGVSSSAILTRLKEWGIDRRKGFMFRKENRYYICDDGHKVKSSSELFIDNWLFHNNIIHIYEKKIGYGNYRCDFYIPKFNLYIEYFGLFRVEVYKRRVEKKLIIYRNLRLNLLKIFPEDNIQKKLDFVLKVLNEENSIKIFDIQNKVEENKL